MDCRWALRSRSASTARMTACTCCGGWCPHRLLVVASSPRCLHTVSQSSQKYNNPKATTIHLPPLQLLTELLVEVLGHFGAAASAVDGAAQLPGRQGRGGDEDVSSTGEAQQWGVCVRLLLVHTVSAQQGAMQVGASRCPNSCASGLIELV